MRQIISLAVALALLALVAVGIYLAVAKFWEALSGADPNIAAALIAASGTVLVSAFSVAAARLLENRARIAEEHRVQKAPIYQELQEFFFKVLFANKMGEKPTTEREMVKFFAEFTPRLSVWGSNDVIRTFVDFRKMSAKIGQQSTSESAVQLIFLYEQVIFKIRSDLGHSNAGLKSGDILSLFITDIENLPKPAG